MGTKTPWGTADSSKVYARGLVLYGTPSHGGFHLTPRVNALIPAPFRRNDGWYEEDCEGAKVIYAFPHLFSLETQLGAIDMLKNYFPDEYEEVTGEIIPLHESRAKAERVFKSQNKDNLVVIAAVGSGRNCPEGFVLCLATKGGERGVDGKYFLVPEGDYRARGEFGFVVGAGKYQESAKGFYD